MALPDGKTKCRSCDSVVRKDRVNKQGDCVNCIALGNTKPARSTK